MCGICGVVGYGDETTVLRMREALAHRGPDAAGSAFFPEQRVGLGHRRLKIIDLSREADQPMRSPCGRFWISFNGELFNFRELRHELEARGRQFRSRSDTEVILQAYEEWGTHCFARFNGMFALAIFDRDRGLVVLARDHFGIKPLYYLEEKGRFTFASEIKGILASGSYSPDVNWQGVFDYFTFLYIPGPQTAFVGIHQLPPAHWLQFDVRTGQSLLQPYWSATPAVDGENWNGNGRHDWDVKRCRELLRDSVRRQMISDVPLGLFLSGGIDSAILAGLMAEVSSEPVKTYTVIFESPNAEAYDEREAARRIARRIGADHHEVVVAVEKPIGVLEAAAAFDQPFANPTSYLMHLISEKARSQLTVALCGAGGDELYAGYPRHRAVAAARWLRRIPAGVARNARIVVDGLGDGGKASGRRLRKFIQGCEERDFAGQLLRWTYFLDEREKSALLVSQPDVMASDRIMRQFLDVEPLEDEGNRALQAEIGTFLADNVLEYTDKMSMAVGLEVRVPYLDPDLVRHALSVPFQSKLNWRGSKTVLKEACRDLLPDAHAKLPKRGFNAPLAHWMRTYLDRYFTQHMTAEDVATFGVFNWPYIQELRHLHRSGKRDVSHELYAIIIFDLWYRSAIMGQPVDFSLS